MRPTSRPARPPRNCGPPAAGPWTSYATSSGILQTTPDGDHAPEEAYPSTAELAALAAESTAVGLATELVQDGDPRLVSPVVGRTVYRIVQEALTNAHKHAPGARVWVRVRYDPAEVRLEVRNSSPTRPLDAGLVGTGSGMGLAGLQRRVELVGGALDAGPAPDGGFRVAATLPAYVPTAASARG